MANTYEPGASMPRRYKRRKLSGRVAVVMQGRLRFEVAVEISEGGMLLRVSEPLEVGTTLEVRFFLPEEVFVSNHAEVVYKLQPRESALFVGIRFLDISDEMRERIAKFVASK